MTKDPVQITKESYDLIAKDYARRRDNHLIWNIIGVSLCKKFLNELPKKKCKVFVAGCCAGNTTIYMAKHTPHYFYGVDFSKEFIKIANGKKEKEGLKNCDFEKKDLITMAIPGKFEGIFSDGVLYHIPADKLLPLLKKFRKALTPDGFFYANFKSGEGYELQQNPPSYAGHPRAYWFHTEDELKRMFSQAGFDAKFKSPKIKLRTERYIEVYAWVKK